MGLRLHVQHPLPAVGPKLGYAYDYPDLSGNKAEIYAANIAATRP